jgi:hypothetical protein
MNLENPLDHSPAEQQSSKASFFTTGKIIELGLFTILVVGILIRDILGFARTFEITFLSGLLLGAVYLLANWWVNKPELKTGRTIFITILYGIVSFLLTFAILFYFLFLPGDREMAIVAFVALLVVSGLDAITASGKPKVSNATTRWRLTALSAIVIVYTMISPDTRIKFVYRNYPEFLEYYESNKSSMEISQIEESYFGV